MKNVLKSVEKFTTAHCLRLSYKKYSYLRKRIKFLMDNKTKSTEKLVFMIIIFQHTENILRSSIKIKLWQFSETKTLHCYNNILDAFLWIINQLLFL